MIRALRRLLTHLALLAALMPLALTLAQSPSATATLRLVSPDARRSLTTTAIGSDEFVGLADLASFFRLSVTEDARNRAVTIAARGKTATTGADQTRVTVDGRAVTLSARVTRSGDRWLVPVDFIPRVVAPLIGQRVDARDSRVVVVGNARVPRVTSRVQVSPEGTRVVIDVAPAMTVATAVDARRILVRVEADALDTNPTPAGGPLPAGAVEQIGPGDQPTALAVTLGAAAGRPRVSATRVDRVMRVTIDVPATEDRPAADPAPAQSAAPPAQPTTPAPATAAAPGAPGTPATPAAQAAGDAVAPPPPNPRLRLPVVVIDPGHGGTDVGVTRGNDHTEKDLTLAVARRVKARIEEHLPVRVVLTRDDDSTLDYDTRATLANGARAELLISLHAGSAEAAPGFAVFYHDAGIAEPGSRRDAARPAAVPLTAGGSRTIAFVPWRTAQADHADAGAMLAAAVDEALRQRSLGGPRPPRRAPLRLLASTNAPAILVEVGWPPDAAAQAGEAPESYESDVAAAIADGVAQFRQRRDERRGR